MKSLSVKLGIILLIGFIIFGHSGVCNAECAWVLWMKTLTFYVEKDPPTETLRWEIIGAVPKYEHCIEMMKNTFENHKILWVNGLGAEKVDAKLPFIILLEKNKRFTFQCFPDTIDPRK